jgi:hypothetical protein
MKKTEAEEKFEKEFNIELEPGQKIIIKCGRELFTGKITNTDNHYARLTVEVENGHIIIPYRHITYIFTPKLLYDKYVKADYHAENDKIP